MVCAAMEVYVRAAVVVWRGRKNGREKISPRSEVVGWGLVISLTSTRLVLGSWIQSVLSTLPIPSFFSWLVVWSLLKHRDDAAIG